MYSRVPSGKFGFSEHYSLHKAFPKVTGEDREQKCIQVKRKERRSNDEPPGERSVALSAAVLLVAGVQLDVTVSAALVLEQATAELATKGHVFAVSLQQNEGVKL